MINRHMPVDAQREQGDTGAAQTEQDCVRGKGTTQNITMKDLDKASQELRRGIVSALHKRIKAHEMVTETAQHLNLSFIDFQVSTMLAIRNRTLPVMRTVAFFVCWCFSLSATTSC